MIQVTPASTRSFVDAFLAVKNSGKRGAFTALLPRTFPSEYCKSCRLMRTRRLTERPPGCQIKNERRIPEPKVRDNLPDNLMVRA